MPAGNFAATLLLPLTEPPARRALRSFVAALALHDALVGVTGQAAPFSLKWPNDVLLHGGKLAGILLEGLGQDHLAIGFGVNLAQVPEAEAVEAGAVPPIALRGSLGHCPSPEVFLEALAAAYARQEAAFRTYGFAPIRSAWLERAAKLGETLTARSMRESWQGRFEGVDETGALILKTAKGTVALAAADVFF